MYNIATTTALQRPVTVHPSPAGTVPAEVVPMMQDPKEHSKQHALVGVGVVVIVLNSPGLEWVDEGHEHQCAHNVFHQLVLAEAAVAAVVARAACRR